MRYPDMMNYSIRSLFRVFPIVGALTMAFMSGCADRGLPDLAAIDDVKEMKQTFYDFLLPIVEAQNARILEQRAELAGYREQVMAGGSLGWWQRYQLGNLADEYEIEWEEQSEREIVDELWLRIDVIPKDLALAQAAKESGWGRSRFAVEINNLFGQWCYVKGCGVVPAKRPKGASHEVEAYSSVSESIRRYMNNLNTHERYAPLRELRARLRRDGRSITGSTLAPGLLGYSERGQVYVEEIQAMIRRNQSLVERAQSA
jgi:Bax protein